LEKPINIARSIQESNSAFLKKLPKFIIKVLERIVQQEKINDILIRNADKIGVDFLQVCLGEFNLALEIEGKENLPPRGKCFFVANHPFGIIDGLVLTHTVGTRYGDLRAIGNDAFMLVPNLRPLIAAVNVYGKTPKEMVIALEEVYASDIPITHFPAGEVSRVYHRKVQDTSWQKSFISKAIQHERDIVPLYFYGRNSKLFYGIGVIRKWLGIKANIELMLLPKEMFGKKNKTIRVKIGKPISWSTFDKRYSAQEWAGKVRSHVYDLPNAASDTFHS
jgi:putative hemolysin